MRAIAFLVAALIAVTALPASAGFHIDLGYHDNDNRYRSDPRRGDPRFRSDPRRQQYREHRPRYDHRRDYRRDGGRVRISGEVRNCMDHLAPDGRHFADQHNLIRRCERETRYGRYREPYYSYGHSGYPGHPSFYNDYRHVGNDRYYDGRGQEYGHGYVREYGSGYAVRPAIDRTYNNGQPPERDVANDPNCETIGDGKYRCRKSGAREERFSSERRVGNNGSADRPEDDVANDPNCEMVLSEEGHRKYRCHRGERVHRREVVEQRVAAPVVQHVQLQTTSTVSKTVSRWYGYAYKYVARSRGEVLRILREDDRSASRVAAAEIQRQIGQRLGMSWGSKEEFLQWFETESVTEMTCTSENIREVDMSRTDAGGSVFDFTFHRSSCYKNETFFVANGEVFLSNVCLNVAVDRQKPVAERP